MTAGQQSMAEWRPHCRLRLASGVCQLKAGSVRSVQKHPLAYLHIVCVKHLLAKRVACASGCKDRRLRVRRLGRRSLPRLPHKPCGRPGSRRRAPWPSPSPRLPGGTKIMPWCVNCVHNRERKDESRRLAGRERGAAPVPRASQQHNPGSSAAGRAHLGEGSHDCGFDAAALGRHCRGAGRGRQQRGKALEGGAGRAGGRRGGSPCQGSSAAAAQRSAPEQKAATGLPTSAPLAHRPPVASNRAAAAAAGGIWVLQAVVARASSPITGTLFPCCAQAPLAAPPLLPRTLHLLRHHAKAAAGAGTECTGQRTSAAGARCGVLPSVWQARAPAFVRCRWHPPDSPWLGPPRGNACRVGGSAGIRSGGGGESEQRWREASQGGARCCSWDWRRCSPMTPGPAFKSAATL